MHFVLIFAEIWHFVHRGSITIQSHILSASSM